MRVDDYELVIRPKDRTPADEYHHKGQTYVEGRHNSTFVIDLINHSSSTVEAVISVDGVSVVDQKPASYQSAGFVVDAEQTVTLTNWVSNLRPGDPFLFANSAGDGGVVGAAWFPSAVEINKVTTGAGNSVDHSQCAHLVPFERNSSEPASIAVINYHSAAELQRRGIQLKNRNMGAKRAFPGESQGSQPVPAWTKKKW